MVCILFSWVSLLVGQEDQLSGRLVPSQPVSLPTSHSSWQSFELSSSGFDGIGEGTDPRIPLLALGLWLIRGGS